MKKQILFVDDERNVLEGLQRMLRLYRQEWDMHFALSGPQALAIMDAKPIDIIIADMRMPEMNGSQLLSEVMQRHPGTIRIVLSGHADADLIMRSVSVTHQYLSKPCDATTLRSVVARAVELRALLEAPSLKHLASQMGTLPSLPSLYFELSRELQLENASLQKIGQIISKDPGMTAKILQLANSSFFGRRRQISNPTEAISYLGLDRIQHLCVTVHAFSEFDPCDNRSFPIDRLWEHSSSTAHLAKRIAETEGSDKTTIEQACTAGFLHDIGELMIASRLPRRHGEAVAWAKENKVPLWEAERQILGASHSEVGAYLLGLWGLPDPIVEAIAYHHRPLALPSKATFCPLVALHAANVLDYENSGEVHPGIPDPVVDQKYMAALGMSDRHEKWRSLSLPLEVQRGA
ncbi:MAG TPA: response regulator [Acidobacteriota bacterium]|nr:response regulator [Acidobacteriota bacterium]